MRVGTFEGGSAEVKAGDSFVFTTLPVGGQQ